MNTDPLDQFAPWPKNREEATAEAMIRYALVRAQAADACTQWGAGDSERQVLRFVVHFTTASLLTVLVSTDLPDADDAARSLWTRCEDGGTMHELTWQWLTERGIDPEAVSKVTLSAFEAREALR